MSKYALPSLPYDLGALEPHLSREILDLHYNKHHAAYVKGANDTLEKLADARERREFGHLGQLEKSLAFHVSGHVLHSLFWKNMSPQGGGTPSGALGTALGEHFGSFDGFKAQLTAAAETVQGSGWGALSWEPLGKRLARERADRDVADLDHAHVRAVEHLRALRRQLRDRRAVLADRLAIARDREHRP